MRQRNLRRTDGICVSKPKGTSPGRFSSGAQCRLMRIQHRYAQIDLYDDPILRILRFPAQFPVRGRYFSRLK